MPNLIRIETFTYLWQAEIAKGLLQQHQIQSVLQRGNPGSLGFPLIGSTDLLVAVNDVEKASQVLSDFSIT